MTNTPTSSSGTRKLLMGLGATAVIAGGCYGITSIVKNSTQEALKEETRARRMVGRRHHTRIQVQSLLERDLEKSREQSSEEKDEKSND